MLYSFLGNKILLLTGFSLGLAILLSLFSSEYLFSFTPFILVFIVLIYNYRHAILLPIILISYLTSITEYIGHFRIYITIIASGLLVILFLGRFGFKFEMYPKIPIVVKRFIILLFICLVISSMFSVDNRTGFFTIITMVAFFTISYILYSFLVEKKMMYKYLNTLNWVVIILSILMFIDLFSLGLEGYALKAVIKGQVEFFSSSGYTGFIIFYVSITFLVAMLMMDIPVGKKIIYASLLLINIFIIILANSRGGIIAGILSTTFLMFVLKRRVLLWGLLSLSVIIGILILTVPFIGETVNIYLRFQTIGDRALFWQSGIDIFYDNPITGIGPNLYSRYFSSYAPSGTYDYYGITRLVSPTPHNIFLYFAAENGVLGFLTIIAFFVMFFYLSIKTMRIAKHNSREYYIISTAITGIGFGLLFRSFIEVTGFLYYGYLTTDLPFWLVFGILISIYQKVNINVANT